MATIAPTMLADAPVLQARAILDTLVYAFGPQASPGTAAHIYASPFCEEIEIRAAYETDDVWTLAVFYDGMLVEQVAPGDYYWSADPRTEAMSAAVTAFLGGWSDPIERI